MGYNCTNIQLPGYFLEIFLESFSNIYLYEYFSIVASWKHVVLRPSKIVKTRWWWCWWWLLLLLSRLFTKSIRFYKVILWIKETLWKLSLHYFIQSLIFCLHYLPFLTEIQYLQIEPSKKKMHDTFNVLPIDYRDSPDLFKDSSVSSPYLLGYRNFFPCFYIFWVFRWIHFCNQRQCWDWLPSVQKITRTTRTTLSEIWT